MRGKGLFWNQPKRRHDDKYFELWPMPSTEIQTLNPCICLEFYVQRAEIPFCVGSQNVPLQNRCAFQKESNKAPCFRNFSVICTRLYQKTWQISPRGSFLLLKGADRGGKDSVFRLSCSEKFSFGPAQFYKRTLSCTRSCSNKHTLSLPHTLSVPVANKKHLEANASSSLSGIYCRQ